MNSDVGPSSDRPQIQVVRLPSNERAKITLDGVQLRAQYRHFRTGDYVRACAVSSGALDRCAVNEPAPHSRSEELLLRAQDSDPTHCYHFCLAPRKRNKQQRDLITNSVETLLQTNNIKNKKQSVLNLSTKSCDNIFEKYFVRGKEKMGFTWKDTTRSEEHLSYVGKKHSHNPSLSKSRGATDQSTAASTGGLASRLLGRLLRRLQPRLDAKRPSEVSTTSSVTGVTPAQVVEAACTSSSPPWIVVSFSRRDLEGAPPGVSTTGDTVVARNTEADQQQAAAVTKHQDNTGGERLKQQQRRGQPHRPIQQQFGHTPHRHATPDMHLDTAPPATPQRFTLHHPAGTRVVPTVHASSRHHYYRSRRGGGAAGRLLLSQHAGAAGSGRPHTLYLAPSTPPTAVTTSTMENRGGTLRKMAASFESIGSCSLDVDITASESSGLLESRGGCGASLSQRTLHSLDSQRLVAHSTEELSTTSSSRQYVKRAAKLFDSADISNSDDSVFTPPRARPSYVSLSCSVSGYTRATNYSSSRLRDPSPCARQTGGGSPSPLLLARTSPAHRSTGRLINPPPPPTMNGHHADTVDCASVKLNGQSSSSVGNMMHFSKQTYISHMGPSSMYNESSSWHSSQVKQPEGGMSNGAAANTSKSFIQQRVERLYGRGALAQGFFRNTKVTTTNGTSDSHTEHTNGEQHSESANSSFPELPVLRLLRPEFREQLSIGQPSLPPWWKQRQSPPRACNGTSPTTSPREHIIPVTIESDYNANQKEVTQKVVATEKVDEPGGDLTSSVVSVCDVAIQAQEIPCDLQPAAPEVVPAVTVASSSKPESDGSTKDGHYFLQLLNKETQRLLAMAAETEVELEAKPDLPEEVSGKLRAAIGQARLLVRQKLQQFEGLCHRNLTQSGEEQFPTTCDDLAGFWDMVQLQVAHVDSLFQELKEMRERGWQEVSPRHEVKNGKPKVRRSTNSASGTPKSTPKLSEKAQEAARLRDEQRKKMMEERRKTAKLQKKAEEGSVEIFVPDANS